VPLTVFCDGYADFIFFSCPVYGGRNRSGPTVKRHEAADNPPLAAPTEIPYEQWLRDFLKTIDKP